MTGIFSRPGDGYTDIPLLDGEAIIRSQTASYLSSSGRPMFGGQLVVTTQRLLFRPLDLSNIIHLAHDGIDLLPDDLAVLGKVAGKILDYSAAYGERLTGAIDTASIVQARTGQSAGLTKPPGVILSLSSGRSVEIGILESIGKPNFWPGNTTARNEIVALINSHLTNP